MDNLILHVTCVNTGHQFRVVEARDFPRYKSKVIQAQIDFIGSRDMKAGIAIGIKSHAINLVGVNAR